MQYLVLGCDPVGDCPLWVQDEGIGETISVVLSPELQADLLNWNERMSAIIAAPDRYSASVLERLREEMNEEGLGLSRRIEEEKRGEAKVEYLPE